MQRTTITAEPELLQRAKVAAAREGVSISELVRQGLEMRIGRFRPRPAVFASADSGRSDLSTRASEGRIPPR